MRATILALMISTWLLGFQRPAHASATADALVVLVDTGVPALSTRLREEVEGLGFSVMSVEDSRANYALEAYAREAGAVAAIRVTLSGVGSVEMTIVDRTTGKTVTRKLTVVEATDPAATELIATRTVELLRASFMELAAAHPARGEVSVPPQVEALTKPTPRAANKSSISVALGPAFAMSNGGFGATAATWVGLTLIFERRWGVAAEAQLPLGPSVLVREEGRVELFASQYRLGGVFVLGAQGRATARFFAGASMMRLVLHATARAPYIAQRQEVLGAGPWLSATGRLVVVDPFSVLVGSEAAFSLARTVIRVGGREAATWGRPSGSIRAGLEWTWH